MCRTCCFLSLTCLFWCVCRHRAIICPVIPDPSAIFKEMIMNGNKELKVYFGIFFLNAYALLVYSLCLQKYSSYFSIFRQKVIFTHRCQSPSNPAKLPLYLKTVSSSKTPDMYTYTAMPAVLLDFHCGQIHLEHLQMNLKPGWKALFHLPL